MAGISVSHTDHDQKDGHLVTGQSGLQWKFGVKISVAAAAAGVISLIASNFLLLLLCKVWNQNV